MDYRFLFDQYSSFSLTLITPTLYEVRGDKSEIYFHDEDKSDLFFIRLNEFLNAEFTSPISSPKKVSVFELMYETCEQFNEVDEFQRFLENIQIVRDYFSKKRFYRYYISPHDIDFEISFKELINIQANYSKHSFYHLEEMKKKIKKHFKKNDIPNYENEDYNEHLSYFKEAVLDDRLNFNSTHIVEILGKLFVSYWTLINSKYAMRIRHLMNEYKLVNGIKELGKMQKPNGLNKSESFFWSIRGCPNYDLERLLKYIPKTLEKLIEQETTSENMILKNR